MQAIELLEDLVPYDDPMQEAYYYYSSLEEGETDETDELSREL